MMEELEIDDEVWDEDRHSETPNQPSTKPIVKAPGTTKAALKK